MTAPSTAQQPSILIVDDDIDIALAMHDLFSHAGFRVEAAHSGADAVAKARYQKFDAVLLDVMLPDTDGLSILPLLRAIDSTLQVIIVTAFADVAKKQAALSAGAFAYVTKPYDTEDLKALVRRAIGLKHLSGEAAAAKEALSASETRFREVVETAPDAIVLADVNGNVLSWNAAASLLFGYATGEILGQPLTMIMPARYRDSHLQALERVRASGEMRHKGSVIKVHGLRKDGREFPIEISLSSWSSHGQRFFCGILRDVTAREEAETYLRRQQIEQQALLDLIPAMVWYKDIQNRILRVNRRAADSLQKSVEEIEGQSTFDLYPEEAEKYHRDDLEVINSGQPKLGIVELYRTGSGKKLWVQTDKVPYRDTDGTVLGVLVFAQDITERKQTEEALRASEERLRVVVESSPNGIVTVNEDGTIVLVNQALAALFGYDRQELLGRSVDLLVPERFRARHPEHRREFFSHPAMRRLGENRFLMGLRKDGSEFPIEIGLAPLATSEGLHVTASIVHVTPRDSAPSPSQS
ncbi:MAG TPA: PAS domain S-box protein [Nitrospira sp.]|nr:PAS domain S-box protein [Nitrospira sp.]